MVVVLSLVAVFATGAALGVLVVMVVGIRAEERRMSLKAKGPAAGRLEAGTRRVLGVGLRNLAASDDRPDRDEAGR
jgi:hypothetical protein